MTERQRQTETDKLADRARNIERERQREKDRQTDKLPASRQTTAD